MVEKERPNPFSVPASNRAFLYDSIVLKHETKLAEIRSDTYDKDLIVKETGIEIVQYRNLDSLEVSLKGIGSNKQFIFFLKNGAAYGGLFKRLRDTFAHGHYEYTDKKWIFLSHKYKGRGEDTARTRLQGTVSFKSIKKLISFIDLSNAE